MFSYKSSNKNFSKDIFQTDNSTEKFYRTLKLFGNIRLFGLQYHVYNIRLARDEIYDNILGWILIKI